MRIKDNPRHTFSIRDRDNRAQGMVSVMALAMVVGARTRRKVVMVCGCVLFANARVGNFPMVYFFPLPAPCLLPTPHLKRLYVVRLYAVLRVVVDAQRAMRGGMAKRERMRKRVRVKGNVAG